MVVEKEKIIDSKWSDFNSNKLIFLSIEDQLSLCYQVTKYIPNGSYAKKNIGYLFAIEHGAKEIYDTDDDFISRNYYLLYSNYTDWRLYYANNLSQMINPYEYYGIPDIWPRGFKVKDINKNNKNNYYSAAYSQFITKPLIYQGMIENPDLDSLFIKTRGNMYSNML